MRWLMWFSLGFAGACAVGVWLFRGMGLVALAAVCLLLMIPAVLCCKRQKCLVAGAVLLAGMALGSGLFLGYDTLYVAPARRMDGQVCRIRVTAEDYGWKTEYGAAVDGSIELEGKRYRLRLYLNEYFPVSPGDVLELAARLRFTDEGGGKEPTFHRTNGILLLGYQTEGARLHRGAGDNTAFSAELRQWLKERIDRCFPEDTEGLAKALLLGDKTGLSYETSLHFRVTGLAHVVAVSGLHVSILFALVYLISGKRRFLTALIGIPTVLLFAAVAGFTPSVTRAAVMQIVMMVAMLLRREYDPPTALSFAVVVMLAWNPLVIASAGFQLSVASVAGIYLFYEKLQKGILHRLKAPEKGPMRRVVKSFASSAALSISATLLTTPLVAYYYGTVCLTNLIANLLVMPVISLIFYGIMFACLSGSLVGAVVSLPIRYVFSAMAFLSELPLAAVYTESVYIVFWLVLVYGIVAVLLTVRPGRIWPAVCCMAAGLGLALTISYLEPGLNDYRVTVLDVGQGQCVILQSRGETVLVDCGGDYDEDAGDRAAEKLLSMGLSRIDGLILTHYDRDHAGGVQYLSERIDIETIYLPKTADRDGLLQNILEATRGSGQIWLEEDTEIRLGCCEILIFAPDGEKSGNESCCAVLFRSEKYDTLITGDMDAAGERALLATRELPDLEMLIVGHHGSGTSTCAELLYLTAPEVAVISVGEDNSYGHPVPEILNRLALYGCAVYRTDLMGDIEFRG